MKDPFISIIIPTYNRDKLLLDALKSLLEQEYQNYEIIVVDQTKHHIPDFFSFLKENEEKIRYFYLEEPNIIKAKNLGAKYAKGEILLFCDDDMIFDKDFLKYHALNYLTSEVDGVASKVISKNQKKPFSLFKPKYIGIKILLSGRAIYNFDAERKDFVYAVSGPVFSIRKSIFEKSRGFDINFPGSAETSYEDVDFGYQLRKIGAKIIYEPKALVFHRLWPEGGCRVKDKVKREYFRFYGAMLFYLKNMPKIFLPYMLFIFFLIAIKKILLSTGSIKDFFFVLRGLRDGFRVYVKHRKIYQ